MPHRWGDLRLPAGKVKFNLSSVCLPQCDQTLELKVVKFSPKSPQKVAKAVFTFKERFLRYHIKLPNIWTNFVRENVLDLTKFDPDFRKSIQIFSPDDGKLESAIESEFLFPIKIDFSPKFREAYILGNQWPIL